MPRPTKFRARVLATSQQVREGKQHTIDSLFGDSIAIDLCSDIVRTTIQSPMRAPISSATRLVGKLPRQKVVCRQYKKSEIVNHKTISWTNKRRHVTPWHSSCAATRKRLFLIERTYYASLVDTACSKALARIRAFQGQSISKKLKFCKNWVRQCRLRQKFRRLRCSTTIKTLQSEEEVRATMWGLQQFIDEEQIFNEDETGIHWCIPLHYQYTMADAHRFYTPEGDDSRRFTAMLASNGVADMPQLFIVLKSYWKSSIDRGRDECKWLDHQILYAKPHWRTTAYGFNC